jgi:SAM-dependent methyltransferase
MEQLPFQQSDPAHKNFQFLEDLATAYWYSEVLFAAIELDLFGWIEKGYNRMETLANAAGCRLSELGRMMRMLCRLELVHNYKGQFYNSQVSRIYLIDGGPDYMGDFFLYRRYMKPQWSDLAKKISKPLPAHKPLLSSDDDYEVRNFHYVRSLDRLARQKVREIISLVGHLLWKGPVLDIGGGAGTLARELISLHPKAHAVLFDLPEVIRAARLIYPDAADWKRIHAVAGDFRFHPFSDGQFGMIVMSNFLHVYGPLPARQLLEQSLKLLRPDGFVLIHDYMPDRFGKSPHKGPLYDLNMMLNTYDGQCHEAARIVEWLKASGIVHLTVRDLQTDTSVIIGGFDPVSFHGSLRHRCV